MALPFLQEVVHVAVLKELGGGDPHDLPHRRVQREDEGVDARLLAAEDLQRLLVARVGAEEALG